MNFLTTEGLHIGRTDLFYKYTDTYDCYNIQFSNNIQIEKYPLHSGCHWRKTFGRSLLYTLMCGLWAIIIGYFLD